MKFYYLIVGLTGMAAMLYLNSTYTAEPFWVSFIIGYTCGTHVGNAIGIYARERRNIKREDQADGQLPRHQAVRADRPHPRGRQPLP